VRRARQNCYATEPVQNARSVKVKEAFVLAPATDKHPAQTQLIDKDVLVGYWTTTKFSGAMPATRIKQLKERITQLQAAVRVAREKANGTEIKKVEYGAKLMDWLFAE
jgi:hypothetical protein